MTILSNPHLGVHKSRIVLHLEVVDGREGERAFRRRVDAVVEAGQIVASGLDGEESTGQHHWRGTWNTTLKNCLDHHVRQLHRPSSQLSDLRIRTRALEVVVRWRVCAFGVYSRNHRR